MSRWCWESRDRDQKLSMVVGIHQKFCQQFNIFDLAATGWSGRRQDSIHGRQLQRTSRLHHLPRLRGRHWIRIHLPLDGQVGRGLRQEVEARVRDLPRSKHGSGDRRAVQRDPDDAHKSGADRCIISGKKIEKACSSLGEEGLSCCELLRWWNAITIVTVHERKFVYFVFRKIVNMVNIWPFG